MDKVIKQNETDDEINERLSKRYNNEKLYTDFEYEGETSSCDPEGTWHYGAEYCGRVFRLRVPRKLLAKAERTDDYNELNEWIEQRQGPTGIWR